MMDFPGGSVYLETYISRHRTLLHEPASPFTHSHAGFSPRSLRARRPKCSSHAHGWGCCSEHNRESPYPPLSADIGRARRRSTLQSVPRSVTGRLPGGGEWRWCVRRVLCLAVLQEEDPWRCLWSPQASVQSWFSAAEPYTALSDAGTSFPVVGSYRDPRVVSEPLGSWFQLLFPLHLNAVSRLTRPVVGNEEMAAFASWLIYPDVLNTSPDFQNPICHRITRLKRLLFILICFSYYLTFFFPLACLF